MLGLAIVVPYPNIYANAAVFLLRGVISVVNDKPLAQNTPFVTYMLLAVMTFAPTLPL
jgi:hypothetical protein